MGLLYWLYHDLIGFRDSEFNKQFKPDNRKHLAYGIRITFFVMAFSFEYLIIRIAGYWLTLAACAGFGLALMVLNVEIEKRLFWR